MKKLLIGLISLIFFNPSASAAVNMVRLKDLVRIQDDREHALIGYGLVVGLARSGDSDRNSTTRQALVNTLKHFNVNINERDLNSRNTAAVMITAKMPPFSEVGDKFDVEVSSIGDARSLLGGTLILTPLYGPDNKLYALAQGPLAVGGYSFEMNGNISQKNHSTVGRIPKGAYLEKAVESIASQDKLILVLNQPDYTTANRIVQVILQRGVDARVVHAGKIEISISPYMQIPSLIASIERLEVEPDQIAKIVINEKTGTIVAGANVRIGEVNISQGNLNVKVNTEYSVSQPMFIGRNYNKNISTEIIPQTDLKVTENTANFVSLPNGATVASLVQALQKTRLSTRDIITIIQAIKDAGALNADLVIQ
ncbi:flagellar basal body P-ring protein FlgI [Acinetobacter sp. 3657]|uniref:flagellar basal body P-ring protein FlgI n=1 Tax=Acinetobacter sp. 3657 TaxID=2817764 RepID=UPI0028619D6D|nr:flagellar P-ring protein precursor FlgI [Prolinoborus sp. 3657]